MRIEQSMGDITKRNNESEFKILSKCYDIEEISKAFYITTELR